MSGNGSCASVKCHHSRRVGAKTAAAHGGGEQRPIFLRFRTDARRAWPRARTEEIERRAHFELAAIGARQRQIDGRAARMARTRRDIAVAEQHALIDLGIKFALADRVVEIVRPAHEIGDGARRPIAIERLEHETLRGEVAGHLRQRFGGGLGQEATRRFIAVDRPADEIVRAGIARVHDQPGHDGGGIDEGGGAVGDAILGGRAHAEASRQRAEQRAADGEQQMVKSPTPAPLSPNPHQLFATSPFAISQSAI